MRRDLAFRDSRQGKLAGVSNYCIELLEASFSIKSKPKVSAFQIFFPNTGFIIAFVCAVPLLSGTA